MRVFAAPGEVTGQAAERESAAPGEHEHRADDDEHQAEAEDEFAQICHGSVLRL